MIPAARSPIDIAFWFLERAGQEGASVTLKRLLALMYLAQGEFFGKTGSKLMPACFVAMREGPVEPTTRLVLESGLQNPWAPELSGQALAFLADFWLRLGALPQPALDRLIGADGAWTETLGLGEGSEITDEVLRQAYVRQEQRRRGPAMAPPAQPARSNPLAALRLDGDRAPMRQAPPSPAAAAMQGFARPPAAPPPTAAAPERKREEISGPFSDEDLKSASFPPADLGFTADGRPIARWKPRRRVE